MILVDANTQILGYREVQCPNITGTSLVYSGRAGKSWYYQRGGGGNYQCLPNNPEYGQYTPGVQSHSRIFGVEYERPIQTALQVPVMLHVLSVMSPLESAVLMIPAWRHCPSQWTLEYTGYLMSEHYRSQHSNIRVCWWKMQESYFQVAILTQMEVFYTMLKQAAMGCHVHHMIHRRSSPVLCALSEQCWSFIYSQATGGSSVEKFQTPTQKVGGWLMAIFEKKSIYLKNSTGSFSALPW